MKVYEQNEIVYCPCCEQLPDGNEDPAHFYVVPRSSVGSVHEAECGNCYCTISAKVLADGWISISGECA